MYYKAFNHKNSTVCPNVIAKQNLPIILSKSNVLFPSMHLSTAKWNSVQQRCLGSKKFFSYSGEVKPGAFEHKADSEFTI